MKKNLFLAGVATLLVGPVIVDVTAYYEDQRLKSHMTEECEAFRQIEVPPSFVLPKRHKQEDTGVFFQRRERCELSIQ